MTESPYRTLKGRIISEWQGERLDRALTFFDKSLSRSRVKNLIEAGAVRLNGMVQKSPSYRVQLGESFEISIIESSDSLLAPLAMELAIVYEDDFVIVIDKPAGLVVHPGPGHDGDSLVNGLIERFGTGFALQQSNSEGLRPGIVHRLDMDTSGLLVVAKTDQAYAGLAPQFAAHTIDRAYHALVFGMPKERVATIDLPIGRSPKDRKRRTVLREGGQQAITHYRQLCSWSAKSISARQYSQNSQQNLSISLLECRLETGRTHQIRVHLAHIGNAVVGDPVYGKAGHLRQIMQQNNAVSAALTAMNRQALHAVHLGFTHPMNGERLSFESKPPKDFQSLVRSLNDEMERNEQDRNEID